MILILGSLGILMIGIVFRVISKKTYSELLMGIGIIATVLGFAVVFAFGTISICKHARAEKDIHKAEMEYQCILELLKIDDKENKDDLRAYVIDNVYEWNEKVYSEKHGADSPWTSWLFSKKYADSLKYISLEE